MNRRSFCRLSGTTLAAAGLSGSLSLWGGRSDKAPIHFSADELRRMYNNKTRLPRPDLPCPLPQSSAVRGVTSTGRQRDYAPVTGADTFMTSWAADGHLYSTYADGFVVDAEGKRPPVICTLQGNNWYFRKLGVHCPLEDQGTPEKPPRFERTAAPGQVTRTGNALMVGEDPFNLAIRPLPPTPLSLSHYPSCYPSGCLVRNGLWITACHYRGWLLDSGGRQLCYEQGPTRFRFSRDFGATWEWSPHDDRRPVIPETGRPDGSEPAKLGTAKFVDFGRNMEHSPDGLAYLVGHGTCAEKGISNWSSGDAVFLARVPPTVDALNDANAFEFFAGVDRSGKPRWSRKFSRIQPVFEWPGRCGLPSMTYFPALRKYVAVLCVGWPDGVDGQYDTWIAEAQDLWGPWSLVTYWNAFADQAYFAQIPSKFIQRDGRFVLFYSGGWSGVKPLPPSWNKQPAIPALPSATYSLCVAEFRLDLA